MYQTVIYSVFTYDAYDRASNSECYYTIRNSTLVAAERPRGPFFLVRHNTVVDGPTWRCSLQRLLAIWRSFTSPVTRRNGHAAADRR